MIRQLIQLADECMELEHQERPELRWLKGVYERFRKSCGNIGKAEADEILYMKMYAVMPKQASNTLKIRFWRTGKHLPSGREQCMAFGRALDLMEDERRYLIQEYYDRSDMVFEKEEEKGIYRERRARMEGLIREYMDKVHPKRRQHICCKGISLEKSLRHAYYTDARSYLDIRAADKPERHIVSINYETEFSRQMKLQGEIPRKTMIRHLLIFGMPFVSREWLSQELEAFGYLPLDRGHTQVNGSCLDRLLLGFLELYEEQCRGKEPEECMQWFRNAYGILDRYLEEKGNNSLRFLYFKALKGNEQ